MYSLIRTWVKALIANLNSTLTSAGKENLKEVDVTMDVNFLPANLKTHTYIIKIGEIEQSDDKEAEIYNGVPVQIEFSFGMYQKDVTQYQEYIDTYLQPLKRLMKNKNSVAPIPYYNATATTSYSLRNIKDIKIIDLKKLDSGGKYLMPSITFELETLDE